MDNCWGTVSQSVGTRQCTACLYAGSAAWQEALGLVGGAGVKIVACRLWSNCELLFSPLFPATCRRRKSVSVWSVVTHASMGHAQTVAERALSNQTMVEIAYQIRGAFH